MKAQKVLFFIMISALTGCYSVGALTSMPSSKMDLLELGMSKKEVADILGTSYTIAEKRIENGAQVEVLSYRDYYNAGEFYMFVLVNDQLERWYRELVPRFETLKE